MLTSLRKSSSASCFPQCTEFLLFLTYMPFQCPFVLKDSLICFADRGEGDQDSWYVSGDFRFVKFTTFCYLIFFCPNLPFVYLGYTYLLRNLHRFPKQSFKRSSEQTAKLSLKVSGRSLRRCMSMLLFSWSVFLRIYMAATFSLAFLFNLFSLLSGFQNIPIKLKSRTNQLGKNKVL